MYKKVISFIAFTLLIEGAAFAGTGIPLTTAGGAPFTFKSSNNVEMTYYADTAPAQNYTINGKNSAGNRVYSSSNNTSNIWYKESDTYKGKTIANSVSITNPGESTYSGWSSQ